jgi:glycosyltransferase involved in cell wall biosynthesis
MSFDQQSLKDEALEKRIRVCHYGTFPADEAYGRNLRIEAACRLLRWQYIPCRVPSKEYSSARFSAFSRSLSLVRHLLGFVSNQIRLALKYERLPDHDLVIIGYPSQLDFLLLHLLNSPGNIPVVQDAFLSIYNTVVTDRKLIPSGSLMAKMLERLEAYSLGSSDALLVDTVQQGDAISLQYGIPRNRFFEMPAGVNEQIWFYRPPPEHYLPLRVCMWSTFIPLHGMEHVAHAAGILQRNNVPVTIRIIGDGQTADLFLGILESEDIGNVDWERRFVPLGRIVEMAHESHCCIGIAGTTDKAGRVIPYKAQEALAAGRPVVTAASPAALSVFSDRSDSILFEPGNPESLAGAISDLAYDGDLYRRVAGNSRIAYEKYFSVDESAGALGRMVEALMISGKMNHDSCD